MCSCRGVEADKYDSLFIQTEMVFWKWLSFHAMTVAVHGPL